MNNYIINKSEVVEDLRQRNLTITKNNVKRIKHHFTKDEMKELLEIMPPDEKGMLLQFLWRTGVRVSEAVGITKKDLNFQENEITIRWLKNRKYEYRIIAMHSTLRNPLYMFTGPMNLDQRIFPFTRQRVYQVCKEHGFNNPHKIRHSFAINFLRQSDRPMAIVELKEILGHAQIQTTMEYLKVVPQNQKIALSKIVFD